MATHHIIRFNIMFTIFIIVMIVAPAAKAAAVRLIHRDSPGSPYYNPNATLSDLANSAVERTKERVRLFGEARRRACNIKYGAASPPKKKDAQVRVRPGTLEYLMEFEIGSPGQPVFAVADTASELSWVQCAPCPTCHVGRPQFRPRVSRTYNPIGCSDSVCTRLSTAYCGRNHVVCQWKENYGDGTLADGELASESFVVGSLHEKETLPGIVFGCSHLTFRLNTDESGIVGLNRQPLSLPSQLKVRKFSYCLVPPHDDTAGSLMLLGENAITSGASTPILTDVPGGEAYYYVTLEGISVGKDRLPIPQSYFQVKGTEGGFIIDSGANMISLTTDPYNIVLKGVQDRNVNLTRKYISTEEEFQLCYSTTYDQLQKYAPPLTFHFAGGADLVLTTLGAYAQYSNELWCLGVISSDETYSVLGNRAQNNYFVGYDLEKNTISFSPAECATF